MYEDNKKSWSIRTSVDELLNFIIFVGCTYNLIDDKNFDEYNIPWPRYKCLKEDKLDISNLKLQWKSWFNDTVEEISNNNSINKVSNVVYEMYNINDFLELKYTELRECCKKSYPIFIEWGICKREERMQFLFIKLFVKINFMNILRS